MDDSQTPGISAWDLFNEMNLQGLAGKTAHGHTGVKEAFWIALNQNERVYATTIEETVKLWLQNKFELSSKS